MSFYANLALTTVSLGNVGFDYSINSLLIDMPLEFAETKYYARE